MRKFALSPLSTSAPCSRALALGATAMPSSCASTSSCLVGGTNQSYWNSVRYFSANHHQRRKQQHASEAVARPTEYDFDKERMGKQMRMTSMECVVQTDIEFPKLLSVKGAVRKFKQTFAHKKLQERFPKYKFEELKPIYTEYKRICNDRTQDDERKLLRVTTHSETIRIMKERKAKATQEIANKSWKSLKISEQSQYSMSVEKFELINIFLGNMGKEDWVQLTAKVTLKERFKSNEEFQEVLEYPVFEANIGDGLRAPTWADFHIVAIMNEDGIRGGKDGDSATNIRKQLNAQKGWLG